MRQIKSPKPERRLFREEIRERLIDDILAGRLAPGTRIIETRLAERFGVSQAPVREALRDLALFGFVVSSPFRGTVVREVSPRELLEIYPIRAALERVAARAAATRIDAPTLEHLDGLIEQMREAAARGDQAAHAHADFSFHQTVVHASGNHVAEHIWETMRLATTTFVTHAMTQLTHRSLLEIGERHMPVLEALRAHDPDSADAAMRKHIEEPGEWMRQAIDREDATSLSEATAAG